MAKVDLTARAFGLLTVTAEDGKDKWGATLWRYRCRCGKDGRTKAANLLSGHTRSCGCQKGFAISTFSPRAAARRRWEGVR